MGTMVAAAQQWSPGARCRWARHSTRREGGRVSIAIGDTGEVVAEGEERVSSIDGPNENEITNKYDIPRDDPRRQVLPMGDGVVATLPLKDFGGRAHSGISDRFINFKSDSLTTRLRDTHGRPPRGLCGETHREPPPRDWSRAPTAHKRAQRTSRKCHQERSRTIFVVLVK